MQTNQIKKFATEARVKLKDGIAAKILQLGFDRKGNVAQGMMPQLFQGGSVWNGQTMHEGFYHQWMSLYHRVKDKGMTEVYEEAAYTWFNRLVAIRILYKNGLCDPILEFANGSLTPRIVNDARMGRMPQMPEAQRQMLLELLDDDTKVTEQFAMLITAWCHNNPIIQSCFGGMADYTELLLPRNILAEGGFVDMLNHTDFITDEDWCTSELIGWLYQFYISERKDEVFAKKGKFEADEIPAATQIFTPNWIVKYMVQNTVGRIFLDKNPYAASMKERWQYLVEPSQQKGDAKKLEYEELTDLKVADLACGSGHILNECFDILFDLYTFEGYTRKETVENIFQKNLTGIDLDTRAQQLSKFALLLKACQRDASFADAHCMPNVLTMPKPFDEEKNGCVAGFLHHFFMGNETEKTKEEIVDAYELMNDADSLGSIMKFDISDSTRLALQQMVDYWDSQSFVPEIITEQLPALRLILTLTDKYSALVMNPPYMGGSNMNATLSRYVRNNYNYGKADLFSVFMLLAEDRLLNEGYYGMINMQSWMFLTSFEDLREHILNNSIIESMLHLGPRTFDELSGEVVQNTAFVIKKTIPQEGACGIYSRLVDGKSCCDKERMFLAGEGLYLNIPQSNFAKIPGSSIGYWVSDNLINAFGRSNYMSFYAIPKQGMSTCDVNRFVKCWFEVNIYATNLFDEKNKKWVKYNKGGEFRRWYGNRDSVVLWDYNGRQLELNHAAIRNRDVYFNSFLAWSKISSIGTGFRYFEDGFLFDGAGGSLFVKDSHNVLYILGLTNCIVAHNVLRLISPTINFNESHIGYIPVIEDTEKQPFISSIVEGNIQLCKEDWDAHETSWDFKENELVRLSKSKLGRYEVEEKGENVDLSGTFTLDILLSEYKVHWGRLFKQLHDNEEELNRQFIEIYGLQDELKPNVPLEEVTILQQGEISIWKEGDTIPREVKEGKIEFSPIIWHDDMLIKQLISYAIGCMMGRYRLDRTGLVVAHPDATEEEIAPYMFNGEMFEIDDDGIIPLMANDCGFYDNATQRMSDFVRQVFGADKQTENLNHIEQCLGKTIEQYFIKDFWKDHKKMYQNRPIYWLFASKKGAFQVITYMHRMNAYTVEHIRSKYLLPYIETLRSRIIELEGRAADLTTQERRRLDLSKKQYEECTEYQERLAVVGEQAIGFDLDDGVVVNHAKFGDVVTKLK